MDGALVKYGHIVDEADESRFEELRAENRRLRGDLANALADAASAKRDMERAVKALRHQLTPLYRALQAVFGEIDAIGVSDDGSGATVNGSKAKWDEWKERLGPSCAKVIDALLLGGEMNVEAIRLSARMGLRTIYDATSKMGRAGILTKSGGKFSLKQL